MRLLNWWFCRVIGVGSVLDIMNLYAMMIIWIFLGVYTIFLLEEVDSKKHRSTHHHGHHRHNHHHRKHSRERHQQSLEGNFTVKTKKRSDFTPKNVTVINIVNATPRILNLTSSSSFFNSNFTRKEEEEEVESLYRNINVKTSTFIPNSDQILDGLNKSSSLKRYTEKNINSGNNTVLSNSSLTSIDSNNFFNTANYRNSTQMNFQNIDKLTTEKFTQPFVNSSRVSNFEEMKNNESLGSSASNTWFNITEVEKANVVKNFQKLFGSAENQKHLADAAIETPVVELIRKKRSAVAEEKEDDAIDKKMRKATLLDFNGPAISNDPEEMRDRESSDALHIRVKRDGSERDDNDRSSLESLDSTYLRNLEDSFALSALEVEAQRSRIFNRNLRATKDSVNNVDSSVNIARIKRDSELKVEEENLKKSLVKPLKSSSDSFSDEDKYIFNNRVNELGQFANRQSSLDLVREDDNILAENSRSTTLANRMEKSVNSALLNGVKNEEDLTDHSSFTEDQGENTNYFAANSETSSSAIFLEKNVNSVLQKRVNDIDQAESSFTVALNKEKEANNLQTESQTLTSAGSSIEVKSTLRGRVNVVDDLVDDTYRLNLDRTETLTAAPINSVFNVDSILKNIKNSTALDLYQEDYNGNDSAIASGTSSSESSLKNVNLILENRVNDIELDTSDSSSSTVKNVTETNPIDLDKDHQTDLNTGQSSVKDVALHLRRSSADNSILKDDNSISRYKLDDVDDPDIIQDPVNPSPMMQLARTKRFADSIVYAEAPDASYANEVVNSRTVDEPYAEDNRIIDSMLSKVDYRFVDEVDLGSQRNENERPLNEVEIDANKSRYVTAIRGKRGTFTKRTREKIQGKRRAYGKKKSHKGRGKKHHFKHSKKKRAREFDSDNSLSDMKRFDIEGRFNDNEVETALDRRNRRDVDDTNDANFYLNFNENAGRVKRDVRKNREEYFERESRVANAVGVTKMKEDAKGRDKRNNSALQELKNLKNSRELMVRQNRSNEITDKHKLKVKVAGAILDIKQIVVGLLAKVDGLYGYVADGTGDEEQITYSQVSRMLSNTSNDAVEVPLNILKQTVNARSADKAAPRLTNAVTRPEACWRHPTSWNREIKPSSNNRPARNLRGQRCGQNLRRKRKSHRKWARWTDWSSCSVTCGRGRQIRWRHCVRNCSNAETEMEEKACQLPACAPGKFLGIFG